MAEPLADRVVQRIRHAVKLCHRLVKPAIPPGSRCTLGIADHQRAGDPIPESKKKYCSVAASGNSVYLVDRECTYLFMNKEYGMRFGLPLEKIIGRRYGDFHSEKDTMEFADCIREVYETGKSSKKEHRSERDESDCSLTFTPIMGWNSAGEIAKVVIVTKDFTERKQVEKNPVEATQQPRETKDMPVQFEKEETVGILAAGVVHELLNPVSIISSRLQFMEDEILAEQVKESVRICREQLQRITRIVHDLHQSSAIRSRHPVESNLRDVI